MKIVFITGAGISSELGLETYSDKKFNNKPEKHLSTCNTLEEIWKYLTPLYNQINNIILPENTGSHWEIKNFCEFGDVTVLTQNIDKFHLKNKYDGDFHGNNYNVIELHGSYSEVECCYKKYLWGNELDKCPLCNSLPRPNIVLYGEAVKSLDKAKTYCKSANLCVIIGTSFKFKYLNDLACKVKQRGGILINININNELTIADINLKMKSLDGIIMIKNIILEHNPKNRMEWKRIFMDMHIYK